MMQIKTKKAVPPMLAASAYHQKVLRAEGVMRSLAAELRALLIGHALVDAFARFQAIEHAARLHLRAFFRALGRPRRFVVVSAADLRAPRGHLVRNVCDFMRKSKLPIDFSPIFFLRYSKDIDLDFLRAVLGGPDISRKSPLAAP